MWDSLFTRYGRKVDFSRLFFHRVKKNNLAASLFKRCVILGQPIELGMADCPKGWPRIAPAIAATTYSHVRCGDYFVRFTRREASKRE